MAQWIYQLKQGKELRDAINNEDYDGTLTNLVKCYKEISQNCPDILDDDDLDEYIDEIENQRDNLENYDEYDMTKEDVIEEIDYLLSNFYDFCDGFRIWVEIE